MHDTQAKDDKNRCSQGQNSPASKLSSKQHATNK
nr:DUF4023 family protein [Paenibacillus cremeus]